MFNFDLPSDWNGSVNDRSDGVDTDDADIAVGVANHGSLNVLHLKLPSDRTSKSVLLCDLNVDLVARNENESMMASRRGR